MPKRTIPPTIIGSWLIVTAAVLPAAAYAQALTAWTDSQQAKRIEQYSHLDTATVARLASVEDDALEVIAKLTTEPAFHFRGGFTDRVRSDNFLRALIDKHTGAVTYQVYEHLIYSGERRDFTGVNVETIAGLTPLPIIHLRYDVRCPYGVCLHQEDIAFDVPAAMLQEIATRADERPVRPWRFRLKAKSGLDWTDDIAPTEAAGLLARVTQWQAEHRRP